MVQPCRWLPLEADPLLFAQYVNALGGPVAAALEQGDEAEQRHEAHEAVLVFEDLLALEPWAAAMLKKPTVAVLLLFPITTATESARREQEAAEPGRELEKNVWFTKQTVDNACGTVALLHCIANLPREKFPLQPGGFLETFLRETASLSPEARAQRLETDVALASAHRAFETKGQSAVPAPESGVDTHFVAFVYDEKTGMLVELDGRKARPVSHGAVLGDATPPPRLEAVARDQLLLKKAVEVIQKEFVDKSPGELRFQVIAVGDAHAPPQM
ncbi:ubiquitin carboxyl-terminal hydrolase UCHL3 [Besnoitia besnoiti]|uniref:ubiquitinyl hydrolase 1 n=1 Tax=Besnoitia besnoiti TaxID=94643 RepID=A0A2A9MKI2_BESBE|nr:ubiquitin carboxyl-terminal hydrolase UCHL3 [Besnoitia besnoiti]PFH37724.1 ubiquitin carboxyl-terminal hydrolase UCHL3 [Besnoitia besnoiti]